MKNKSFEASKGFTLVELMVVIAIIGILAVVALGIVRGAQSRAKDTSLQATATNLTTALESYYSIMGGFPETLNALWDESSQSKILDKELVLPSGCAKLSENSLGTSCGITYTPVFPGDNGLNEGYRLEVHYINSQPRLGQNIRNEIITGGQQVSN